MAKSNLTKEIERVLYNFFDKRAEACCPEVTLGWYGNEIVDFMTYSLDKNREIKCYEIKVSKADFHSKAKLTFVGHKNYFVMPTELYKEIEQELYTSEFRGIGVYTFHGGSTLECSKYATRRELRADKEVILSSMLRSMQREYLKARKEVNV